MEECKKGKAAGTSTIRCKKPPVTVTREGGVSAPDWRREDATPRRGRARRGLKETPEVLKEKPEVLKEKPEVLKEKPEGLKEKPASAEGEASQC